MNLSSLSRQLEAGGATMPLTLVAPEKFSATPSEERVVEHLDQRINTGAGVSAGIDMALRVSELLVDDIAAKTMQLAIEHCQQPSFASRLLSRVDDDVIERLALYVEDKA
jgi:hypothetical protein